MLDEHGRNITLCAILNKISEITNDEDIKCLAGEARAIAKKMDAKLKEYSLIARRSAQALVQENWQ